MSETSKLIGYQGTTKVGRSLRGAFAWPLAEIGGLSQRNGATLLLLAPAMLSVGFRGWHCTGSLKSWRGSSAEWSA